MSQVSYGTITITDTNDIESITVEYAQNQDSSNPPSSGWNTGRPTWKQNYFIWQRTRIHKSGTTADKDTFGAAVCLTGSTGSTGAPGRGLTDTITKYCNYGAGTPAENYRDWVDAPPSYDSSKPNYWVKIANTYNAAPTSENIIYKDEALTKAVTDAAVANSIAQQTIEDAQGALSIATGINQHFFSIPNDYSASVPAGSYITEINVDEFKQSPSGGNLLTRSDGVWLRNGADILASLQGTGLTFLIPTGAYKGRKSLEILGGATPALKLYDAQNNNAVATLNSNGLVLSKGGITVNTVGSNDGMYISSEDLGSAISSLVPTPSSGTPKTNWRAVIGSKFGVDSEGNLYANEAHISGEITASKLMISSNATINDTSGLISNSAVEVGGRNLFIGSIDTHLVNGSVTDTKTTTMLYFWTTPEESYTGYNSFGPTKTYSTTGHFTETFTAANDALNYFCIKHNGSTHDFAVYFEVPEDGVKAGETLTMSFDIVGFNPSVENGLDIKNFKLERGNKATDWTPAPEDIQNALGNKTENSDFDEYKEAVGNDLKDISDSAFGDEDSLATRLSSVSTGFDKLSSEYSGLASDIKTYISFDGALVLGNSENGNNVTITDSRVQFKDYDDEVGYIDGDGLHVNNYLSFGNFMFYQRTNGHFTLKYVKKEDNE